MDWSLWSLWSLWSMVESSMCAFFGLVLQLVSQSTVLESSENLSFQTPVTIFLRQSSLHNTCLIFCPECSVGAMVLILVYKSLSTQWSVLCRLNDSLVYKSLSTQWSVQHWSLGTFVFCIGLVKLEIYGGIPF